jgi:hypothetical protein
MYDFAKQSVAATSRTALPMITNGAVRPMRSGIRAVAVCAVIAVGGCAYHGAAEISTIPEGAEVVNIDDQTVLGQTPIKVWWQESDKTNKHIVIRLQRDGYRDKVTSFWVSLRHSSKEAALNEPQHVEVQLEKDE